MRGLRGYEAMAALENSDIYIEMADARRLVLYTSPEDDPIWYDRLLDALAGLPYGDASAPQTAQPDAKLFSFCPPIRRVPLRQAMLGRTVRMPLRQAVGRVMADTVGVYPPGIAAVLPGEVLQKADCEALCAIESAGAALFGVQNGLVAVSEP